ncbi:hypothetical protein [Candidatus Mycolicibacterium alkanivorans]|uniref:Uncharacterized protein n=1 Tax=Candidatus Mycolicibacterium alkanivorans TaxID=2954114 RepID=A0ABS9YRF1_9MYCO|nr:hypothetical protein [Candidatus Mycolicibacterium alkanivorans]MCI4673821.1 hypothetical protein [Candidatus Mycolicibacterium alkanivorans]
MSKIYDYVRHRAHELATRQPVKAADKRAEDTFKDAEAVLKEAAMIKDHPRHEASSRPRCALRVPGPPSPDTAGSSGA